MTLAVLMVHFDGKPAAYRRLRLAADLANRFEAALIGIAGRSYLPSFLADGNTALQKKDEQEEMAVVLADLGDKFRTAAKHVSHVEWRGVVADATHLVSNEARAADLIIIGREQDAESFYYTLNPSTAVVRMGRPVCSSLTELRRSQPGASWWLGRIRARRGAPFAMQSRFCSVLNGSRSRRSASREGKCNPRRS